MLSLIALLLTGAADTPVPMTLLREPVRVEIVAEGSVETPPDRFRVSGTLITRGASVAVVQAELDKHRAAITREMAGLGGEVSPQEDAPLLGFVGNEQNGDEGEAAGPRSISVPDQFSFDAADRATADRLVAALKKDGLTSTKVTGFLSNDVAAIDSARIAAIGVAYAKVQRTAAALGMRVSALRRIGDQADTPESYIAHLAERLGRVATPPSGNVVTRAALRVEFELMPTP